MQKIIAKIAENYFAMSNYCSALNTGKFVLLAIFNFC